MAMKTYIIKIKDIKIEAKSKGEAEEIAIDIVNDIGHYGKNFRKLFRK